MSDSILGLASFLISAFAFSYGAARLFKKKTPLYLQLYVCAAGCFSIQQLSGLVNTWCGVNTAVSIGMFGIFGCNFFLLSANYGTLDRVVDDGKVSQKARRLAFSAPVCMAALAACGFLAWGKKDLFNAVMWLLVLLPSLPASYFNLKHILLPMDPFEFLRATRPCNLAALVFYFIMAVYVICSALFGNTVSGMLSILVSLSVLNLTLCAEKGAKRWGI